MGYKIRGSSRKGSVYEFIIEGIIEGERDWTLDDLTSLMKVSEKSNYYLSEKLQICDRRSSDRVASLELISTASPNFKKLIIRDDGIGKQMIEKFVGSIQKD